MASQTAESSPTAAPTAASPAGVPATAEDVVAATRKEYGQYVAADQIFHGNALAYNQGDPVPASNVKLHGYDEDGRVVKAGSKAHGDLLRSLGRAVPES